VVDALVGQPLPAGHSRVVSIADGLSIDPWPLDVLFSSR
jgi:hypothetical protein